MGLSIGHQVDWNGCRLADPGCIEDSQEKKRDCAGTQNEQWQVEPWSRVYVTHGIPSPPSEFLGSFKDTQKPEGSHSNIGHTAVFEPNEVTHDDKTEYKQLTQDGNRKFSLYSPEWLHDVWMEVRGQFMDISGELINVPFNTIHLCS